LQNDKIIDKLSKIIGDFRLQFHFNFQTNQTRERTMKFLITLILAATFTFSQQSFIFNSDVNSTAKQTSEQATNRFIVNIVEYSFVNGTSNIKTAHKFRCLGLLIDTQYVLTTAECVHQQSNHSVHIGVQFTTTSSSGPDRNKLVKEL
jgi:secreted trypsin-like serine protease